jgi:hypothetical protein
MGSWYLAWKYCNPVSGSPAFAGVGYAFAEIALAARDWRVAAASEDVAVGGGGLAVGAVGVKRGRGAAVSQGQAVVCLDHAGRNHKLVRMLIVNIIAPCDCCCPLLWGRRNWHS